MSTLCLEDLLSDNRVMSDCLARDGGLICIDLWKPLGFS